MVKYLAQGHWGLVEAGINPSSSRVQSLNPLYPSPGTCWFQGQVWLVSGCLILDSGGLFWWLSLIINESRQVIFWICRGELPGKRGDLHRAIGRLPGAGTFSPCPLTPTPWTWVPRPKFFCAHFLFLGIDFLWYLHLPSNLSSLFLFPFSWTRWACVHSWGRRVCAPWVRTWLAGGDASSCCLSGGTECLLIWGKVTNCTLYFSVAGTHWGIFSAGFWVEAALLPLGLAKPRPVPVNVSGSRWNEEWNIVSAI